MSSEYRLRPAAGRDLEAIVDYLAQRSPIAAVRFVEAAQATFEHIGFMPEAFPAAPTRKAGLKGIRWRALTGAFTRYAVFYRAEGTYVDVVRVLHLARDIEAIFEGEE